MGKLKEVGDIQVEEDLGFLQSEWRWQRVGWIVMALILAAALAGAFGRGPISKTRAGNRELAVAYERIIRHGDSEQIEFVAGAASDTVVELAILRRYLAKFEVQAISPEPESQRDAGDFIIYEFVARPADSLVIKLDLHPTGYGVARAMVQATGRSAVRFSQFILP
jgi:hypothetical protein